MGIFNVLCSATFFGGSNKHGIYEKLLLFSESKQYKIKCLKVPLKSLSILHQLIKPLCIVLFTLIPLKKNPINFNG